jgi:mannosyltransferase
VTTAGVIEEPPAITPWWTRRDPLVAAGATVVLAVLSVFRLGSKQLWIDEGVAVGLTQVPFSRFVFVITHWEVNQAPFYALFRLWSVLGSSPAVMRLLPALFAVATVPVTYLLGRRLYGSRVGSYAAALLAVNALLLQWAQQLRGYTLAVFLITLATLVLVQLVERPSAWRGLAYAVVAVAAVGSHFFCALVIVAHAISLVFLRPRPTRVLVAAGTVVAVALAPFAWFVATAEGQPLAWIDDASTEEVLRVFVRLAGGALPLVAYGVVGGAGLIVTFRVVRPAPRSVEAWHHLLPAVWLVFPLASAIIFSILVEPIVVARFFLIVVPAIVLLVGLGLASIANGPARAVAGTALVVLSLLGCLNWYRAEPREDWTAATTALLAEIRPGDVVVVSPRSGGATAAYYGREAGGVDLPIEMPDTTGPAVADRLWEVRRGPTISGWWASQGLGPWLERNYQLVSERSFHGVSVRLHERRA